MGDSLIFAYRSVEGCSVKKGPKRQEEILSVKLDPRQKLCRTMRFGNTGSYLAYCDGENTICIDASTGQQLFSHALAKTSNIFFSPGDKYIVTFEPYVVYGSRNNEDGTPKQPNPNVNFIDVTSGKILHTSIGKNNLWRPQFSDDESICVRVDGSTLQFYEVPKFDRFVRTGVIKDIGGLELSPGLDPILACFIPATKGQPGIIQLRHSHGQLSPICQKSTFNCDNCLLKWNCKGNSLLAVASTDVDKTNSSYYGMSTIYLLCKSGDSCQVHVDKPGTLHAIQWSPTGSQFAVCYGYMPAKVAVFNLKANVIWDLGECHQNELYYNAFGNILVTCGFGNIAAGKMQFWDVEKRSKIVALEAPSTTYFEWAPDGQHFLTATTAPRLRCDNNFRIWNYTGEMLMQHDMLMDGKQAELYQVNFKPVAPGVFNTFKVRELTDADHKKLVSLKGVDHTVAKLQNAGIVSNSGRYIPPALRKAQPNSNGQQNSASDKPKVVLTETEKKLKNLRKKLADIAKLKEKAARSEKLEPNQLEKILKFEELSAEIERLSQATCD